MHIEKVHFSNTLDNMGIPDTTKDKTVKTPSAQGTSGDRTPLILQILPKTTRNPDAMNANDATHNPMCKPRKTGKCKMVGKKTFKCKLCNKYFGYRSYLKRHISAVHEGIKL